MRIETLILGIGCPVGERAEGQMEDDQRHSTLLVWNKCEDG